LSSPQHRGVSEFRKGHAAARFYLPVVVVIGAGAKAV